jgi:integrase
MKPMTTPSCEASMRSKLPPYVKRVRNKVGRPYLYFQRGRGTPSAGPILRLPDDEMSPEFWAEYARIAGLPVAPKKTNTVFELVKAWQASPEWEAMKPSTHRNWSCYAARIVTAWGDIEVKAIEPKHVLALRDRLRSTPAAANNLLSCLSAMLRWSVPRGWRPDNPCREVPKLKGGEGYAPWPLEVVEAARQELLSRGADPLWWAIVCALYTGQRCGDLLAMRWDALQGNVIAVQQEKTGKRLAIPIHSKLRVVLAAIPRRAVTILTSPEGRPWTRDSFKSAWKRRGPSLPDGLVFHGLRKSAVVTLLEAGCTEAEACAVTGQSLEMLAHYAKGVNQRRLAAAAIRRWEREEN